MTTAHCSAVTGSAYEAMMIACTWIGARDDDGCEDVLDKEEEKQRKMVITFSPFSQDADHRFPSWHGPPCRCSRCTCTWAGLSNKASNLFTGCSKKVPDRITKEKSIKPQTWNLSFKGPWKEPQM